MKTQQSIYTHLPFPMSYHQKNTHFLFMLQGCTINFFIQILGHGEAMLLYATTSTSTSTVFCSYFLDNGTENLSIREYTQSNLKQTIFFYVHDLSIHATNLDTTSIMHSSWYVQNQMLQTSNWILQILCVTSKNCSYIFPVM